MVSITRRLEFDAGHRVLGHEGHCKHLHGHHYVVEITVSASSLDSLGRVLDFGKVKELVGGWLNREWDHNLLLHPADPLLMLDDAMQRVIFAGKKPYVMECGNPTAENMAEELWENASKLLPAGMKVSQVRVWETPNCYADFFPG